MGYQVSVNKDEDELNPNNTHYLLIDDEDVDESASVLVDSLVEAIVSEAFCPTVELHAGNAGSYGQTSESGRGSLKRVFIAADEEEVEAEAAAAAAGVTLIDESNWSQKLLAVLKPASESPFLLMMLSLAWNDKKFGMQIIEETKEAGLKIGIERLFSGDSVYHDLDVVLTLGA